MSKTLTKEDIQTHIREALSVFIEPATVVELRALDVTDGRGYHQTYSGYFDKLDKLVEATLSLDGKATGIYIIPSPVKTALLSRAANRVRGVRKEPLTSDQDILRRRWLLIDLDAVRPSGISSTEEEHQLALAQAGQVRDRLTSFGWPLPVEGDSGNGGHLSYRIDLPNNEGSRQLLQDCLNALAALFNTDQVKVDTTVYNAARIWKLYGTMTKKGDNTPDRPHRRAWLLSKPKNFEVVSVDLLRKLAEMAPKAELPSKKSAKVPTKAREHRELSPDNSVPTDSEIIIRARQYLAAIPGAVAGQNGDHATYKVACVLMKDFGLSEVEAFPLFQEWNAKCSPPWEESDLIKKLRHAAKYGKHQLGEKAPEEKPRKRKHHPRQEVLAEEGFSTKPVIRIRGGHLPKMVDQAEQALLASDGPLYQRNGCLVRMISDPKPPKGIKRAEGALVIQPIDVHYLLELFTKVAIWGKYNKREDEWVQVDCPKIVAETYLSRGTWNVPILTGIIEAPTLRPDGSILEKPGYDQETGLLFHPGETTFLPIPPEPTQEDVLQAVEVFRKLLSGFPFVSNMDFVVALAAILTGLIRRSLRTAPLTGFSAPKMGSGKSLLADTVAMTATGRPASVMSQSDSPEEEKKRYLAVLMEGDPVVCIDNVERPLGSDSLCSILTQISWKERLLGKNKTVNVPTSVTFLATGNNLAFQGDLSTRTLLCLLDPQCERPEERTFDVNLYQYIPKQRAELVKTALTILRAYHVASRPKQNIPPYGRFEEWSNWVRSALVWLGLPDPCESKKRVEDADPTRALLKILLHNWYDCLKEAATLKEVVQIAREKGNEDFLDALMELAGEKGEINQRKLGRLLKYFIGRIEDGFRLEQVGRQKGGFLWRVRVLEKKG